MPKDKKKLLSKWLEGMLARIKELAPKPDEPPMELEEEEALSQKEREAYYARHWVRRCHRRFWIWSMTTKRVNERNLLTNSSEN